MNYFQKKKLFLMSIVNKIKGFIRTITGAPPITLEDCVDEESVINYQLYGNSVQDGEPSPDNPVEVKSVGERTKNLFDESLLLTLSTVTKVNEGYLVKAYPAHYSHDTLVAHLRSVIKPGVTYTLSRKYIRQTSTQTSGGTVAIRSNTGTIVSLPYNADAISFSLTQEEVDSIANVYVYGDKNETIIYEYIQIEEGSEATEYEPYGYKIPITATSDKGESITTSIYLNEPLRAIGDYKDYIDFENGKIVRNIAESQFLSRYLASKSGSFSGTVTGFLVSNTSPFGKAKTGLPKNIAYGFNSIGEVAGNANDYNTRKPNTVGWMPNAAGNTVSFFAMPISFLTDNGYTNDLTGAEDWVDAQNSISPIMITYILETPTEETIELSNLPTFKGNTTYTIDTTIQPTNMVVNYYSTTKGE